MNPRFKTDSSPTRIDVRVENYGSLVLVRPVSVRASRWIGENVQEDAMYFGGALVVEPRYLQALVDGMKCEGLEVQ